MGGGPCHTGLDVAHGHSSLTPEAWGCYVDLRLCPDRKLQRGPARGQENPTSQGNGGRARGGGNGRDRPRGQEGSLTSLVAEGGQARQSGRQISERHVCQAQGAFGKAGGPDWVCLRRQTHLQRPGPPAAGTPPPSSASGNGSAQSDHHRHALRTRGWSEVGEVQSGELALTMVS